MMIIIITTTLGFFVFVLGLYVFKHFSSCYRVGQTVCMYIGYKVCTPLLKLQIILM